MKKIRTFPKADARLSLLLNKSIKSLEKLKIGETKQLQEIHSDIEKLHARLRKEKDEKKREKLASEIRLKLEHLPAPLSFGLYFPKHNPKVIREYTKIRDPFVSVLVKAKANFGDLEKSGVHLRNRAGDIYTAFIPFKRIPELLNHEAVEFIELARPDRNNLGQAIPYAQINTLHAAPTNATGAGVVIAVLDDKFDIYHPDFRNNDGAGGDGQGSSRVLFFWDQALAPNAGESSPPVAPALPGFSYAGGIAYGTEYSQADINAELNNFTPAAPNAYNTVRHIPGDGEHGTHVAGCAAGNGRSGAVGAAPGADLIFVALRGTPDVQGNYIMVDNASTLDAFSYVFARAAQLGRPCIANRSGSDNMGPHDGTTLGERFLDNLLLTTDRVITFAAGNTNDKTETILGAITSGGTNTITITYNSASRNDIFEIWYDGHDRFDISLQIPGVAAPLAVTAGNNGNVVLANGINVTILSALNDPRNGDNRISIFIENVSSTNRIPAGNWVITLTGATVINGSYAAWLERGNRGQRTLVGATVDNMSMATPATGLRIIAAGSHNDTATPPAIASSSSCGPTRDGRIKPEIATVGVGVRAANSKNMNTPPPGYQLTVSMSGTSMASPIVAGTCALLYQCRGAGLSWFDLKQILQNNTAAPATGVPGNQFGFGYLQIANGCNPVVNDVDVWLRDASTDTGTEPFTGSITWLSPDIEVLDMLGNPVSNPTHNPANFVNNIIRVTARNRSATQIARNVEVNLYWADPGTAILFPADWKNTGIYTGTPPNFVNQTNRIVIPQIPAGGAVAVQFAWAPPAPGSNVRGDDHFCLLARLEHEADASNIGSGGWGVIAGSNNIALRNLHIVAVNEEGDAASAFYVIGTKDTDSLELMGENIKTAVKLYMPAALLEWYDLPLVDKYGLRRPFQTEYAVKDPLNEIKKSVKPADIFATTGMTGVDTLEIRNGIAELSFTLERGKKIVIPVLNIANRAVAPVRVAFRGVKSPDNSRLHIRQLSGGVRQTGVTIELTKRLIKSKVKSVRFDGKKLIIK